jgi:N-acetylgalactosamine-6-sulfatase
MRLTRRAVLGTALGALSANATAAPKPPNIVLLMADDMGLADLSIEGATDIRTPHIDSIGKQGVRFTQAYCNAPECTPSRTALLTGRYQQRVGGLECAIGVGNVGRYDDAEWLAARGELGLPASEPTIGQLLKQRGYDTACIGKWHLGYLDKFSPNRHGFDEYFGILGGNADYFTHREEDGTNVLRHNGRNVEVEGYLTDLIGDRSAEWIARRGSKPFFLYVPFTAPHSPYQSLRHRTFTNKGDRGIYAEMVESMDTNTGKILAALERRKLADNTWVIFLSDNGATQVGSNKPLRGGKSSVWEGGIRTPCLMRWPGVFGAGTQTGQVSMMMDITASILHAAGAKLPKLDGLNLLPVWQGKSAVQPRTVFWRYRRADNYRKAVRDGDWKLVHDNGKEELHHLAVDSVEKNDQLAAEPAIAAALRKKLSDWEQEVRAPRLAQR